MLTKRRKTRFLARCLVVILIFLSISVWTSGCFLVSGKYKMGETITEEMMKKIQPGKTVKQDILEWFGPPIAIARKGAWVKIPRLGTDRIGWDEIQSDSFFELFSSKHTLTQSHMIYYYHCGEDKATAGMFIFYAHGEGKLWISKLWVLIDETTGIVTDYLFRKE